MNTPTPAHHRFATALAVLLSCAFAPGCSSDDKPSSEPDAAGVDDGSSGDTAMSDTAETDTTVTDTAATDAAMTDAVDDDGAGGPAEPATDLVFDSPWQPPADPLSDSDVSACSLYQQTRCGPDGTPQVCVLYDTKSDAAVADPDPLLERVLWYERWYELYSAPDGQTADRQFKGAMAAGTPEAEWGSAEVLGQWAGIGDAAIWSGVALNAFVLRYLQTGTDADRARVEKKTRQLLTHFDVTGIPGYLARHHFLAAPEGTPQANEHAIITAAAPRDQRDNKVDLDKAVDLPEVYRDGVLTLPDGATVAVEGWWQGNPSIDQYTGPLTALPIVHEALGDPALNARIEEHVVCYLNRLRRIEIRNLQQAGELLDAVNQYLAGGVGTPSEDAPDPTKTDTMVLYVLPQFNAKNADTYDKACPDGPMLQAAEVLDASGDGFLLQLLDIAQRAQSSTNDRADALDHFYIPNVRGGDAMHLMHLAALAWHWTGEPQYKAFFDDVLVSSLKTHMHIRNIAQLVPPPWCRGFYGSHITFMPLWGFAMQLGDSGIRAVLIDALQRMWSGSMKGLANAKFDLQLAGLLPEGAPERPELVASALDELDALGGNGGVLLDPRRTYSIPRADVVAALPDHGLEVSCPTETERALCEDGFNVLGIQVPGEEISHACDGRPAECALDNGQCADGMASGGLPVELRRWQDFLWQRSPFDMGREYPEAIEGYKQAPGLDLIESYWIARAHGFVGTGEGQVLAWQPGGDAAVCAD